VIIIFFFNLQGNAGSNNKFVFLVGMDNYYRLYDVMVGTYNNAGMGPNSTVHQIYSSEDSKSCGTFSPNFEGH
jgi:hypothetical protein